MEPLEKSRTATKVVVGPNTSGSRLIFVLIFIGARCNEGHPAGVGLSTCLCIHAEENALLEAGRERIREGSILYCNT